MGIQGAAVASLIAWAITSVLAIWVLLVRKKMIVLDTLDPSVLFKNWRSVLKISLPAALSNMMTPLANGILTAIVAQHGAAAVAAFGVGSRIESLALLVCLALSMTLPPFISQNLGAKQIARVRSAYSDAVFFALSWQLLIYLLLALGAGLLVPLFTNDSEVGRWLVLWMLIVPLGFGFQATTFLSSSSFNALHLPYHAMRVSIVRLFLFYIPLGWLGSTLFDLKGLFIGLVVANALTAIFAWFWMIRTLKRV